MWQDQHYKNVNWITILGHILYLLFKLNQESWIFLIVKPLQMTQFLSPELMDLIHLCENMHVGSSEYKLKGMVRCYNGHFTCAVLTQGKWTYIDDLCVGVKEFCTLAALKRQFSKGWFFAIYEDSNMVSKPESCGIVNKQMKSNIDFTEIPIKRRCFKSNINFQTPVTTIMRCLLKKVMPCACILIPKLK